MKEITFIHTADLHIGAQCGYLGTLGQRRRSEVLVTFRRITHYCKEHSIPFLIIAGDLFDSNNVDEYLIDEVFSAFGDIPETKIIFAAGNHDPLTSDSPFLSRELPPNVTVLPTKDTMLSFDEPRIRIYGRSFSNVYEDKITDFEYTPPQDDYFNLMVLHGDAENSGGAYRAIPTEFIEKSGMDYIALGHVHSATPLKKAGNTYYAYSGCPDGQGFDEAGQKGFYLVTLKNGKAKAELVPCAARMHIVCEADITGVTSSTGAARAVLSLLKENYGEDYTENIYKIILTGTVSRELTLNMDEIVAELSANVFFAKFKNKVRREADYASLAKEQTLKGIFVKKMLEKIAAAKEDERETLENALSLALEAFEGEVDCIED